MGYWKNLEIAMQDEEGDRYPTRRQIRKRRATYRPPNAWVFNTVDMAILSVGFVCAIGLGFVIGTAVGS